LSFIVLSPCICWLLNFYTLYNLITHDFEFMRIICALSLLECRWSCDFHIFMDIHLFYFLLEGFRTNFKNYLKLVHYSSIGRVFKYVKIFSNHIFENPYLRRVVGWATIPCILLIEYIPNMCMITEVVMRYTRFLMKINFCILIFIFYVYVCIISQLILYLALTYIHIDIFLVLILQYPYIFRTNWFNSKLDLVLKNNWYLYKLMHYFY